MLTDEHDSKTRAEQGGGSRVTGVRLWVAVENRVIRLGITEKITLEHRLEGGGVSQGLPRESFGQKEQLMVLRAWSPPRSQMVIISGNLLKTHIRRPHQ